MAKIKWDETGKKFYETGVKNGVLYIPDESGKYTKGFPWNGLISVTEKPTGAEKKPLYADNIKYLNLTSVEEFAATIQAYTYPDEFAECDGSASLVNGVTIGQQKRKSFGMAYKTIVGDDVSGDSKGYKLHLIYGATASPSEKAYNTINESPDAIQFSWEMTTVPVPVEGFEPTAFVVIDSRTADTAKLQKLEETLFGSESAEPKLLLPDEIKQLFEAEG